MPEPIPLHPAQSSQPQSRALAARMRNVVVVRGEKPVIRGMTLDLQAGGVTALIGPNGAGKSLTLRLLAGLIEPTSGTVDVDLSAGRVALVFQRPVLLRRSVRANLAHALASYGVPRRERRDWVAAWLDTGRLNDLADRPARVLSGGEQQRVAMVRAMAGMPSLLLLDEPTASLDPQSTAHIEALIELAVADGVTVVLVTHDRHQAHRLADNIAFVNRGRVVEQSTAQRFFQAPGSTEARAYLDGRLLL